MKLKGKRVVILVAHEFEDIEALYTVVRLSEEGARITVATLPLEATGHFHPRPYFPSKPVTGRFGSTVPFYVLEEGKRWVHRSTDDLRAEDYDGVVIPGGFAPDFLRCDPKVLSFVASMYRHGKIVAAICHGPQVLISTDAVEGTDIIRGKKVSSWLAVRDDIGNAGGQWVDVPAVRQGNVITGQCPDSLPEFCQEIILALSQASRRLDTAL